jgi:uncharacterized membrane protein (DUF485 family)
MARADEPGVPTRHAATTEPRFSREGGAPTADRAPGAEVRDTLDPDVVDRVAGSAAFGELVERRQRFTALAGGAFLVVFLGFLLLAGYARGFMGQRLVSSITVGYALAILVFVAIWVVVGAYIRVARTQFDPLAAEAIQEEERR